jgi:hypothetical protein
VPDPGSSGERMVIRNSVQEKRRLRKTRFNIEKLNDINELCLDLLERAPRKMTPVKDGREAEQTVSIPVDDLSWIKKGVQDTIRKLNSILGR